MKYNRKSRNRYMIYDKDDTVVHGEITDFSINGGSSTGYTYFKKSILTSTGKVLVGYMKLKGRKSTENI